MIITGLPDDGIRENYNRIFVAVSAKGSEMPRTRWSTSLPHKHEVPRVFKRSL